MLRVEERQIHCKSGEQSGFRGTKKQSTGEQGTIAVAEAHESCDKARGDR